MLQFNRWQIGTVIAVIALGAYFAIPNFFAPGKTPPGFVDSRVVLGLDLQGGSYLLLEVDTDKVLSDRITLKEDEVRSALRGGNGGERIPFQNLRAGDDYSLSVTIRDAANVDRAFEALRKIASPLGGFTTVGVSGRDVSVSRGEGNTIRLALTEDAKAYFTDKAVTDSIEVVRRRIDALGTTEPQIQRNGTNRLVVQVPGDSDSEALKSVINRTGQLSFHMVDSSVDPSGPLPRRRIVLPMAEFVGQSIVLEERALVTGDMVVESNAAPNQDGPGFEVNFGFDNRGATRFRDATTQNVGRQFAIVLDEEVISAPRIISPITGGQGRITGRFTPEEATELSILIRSGALPAPLTTIEQRTVGADLGADSVRAGTIALIVGFLAVIVFIVATYGRFGIYADIALFANVLLIAGALSMLGATLTLPGIAGVVLTIGMAVDANVLVFERIREELKAGKKPIMAVEAGYKHAQSAIFDANITTLIAAFIMFSLGSGPVKGFAVTLGIGVITSVFTAFVVTRIMTGRHVLANRGKPLVV